MPRRYNEPEYRRRVWDKARKDEQDAQNERRQDAEEADRKEIVAALHAINHDQQAYSHQHQAEDGRNERRERIRLWVDALGTAGLLVAAGVGAAAIWFGANDSHKNREIMSEQAAAMRAQLAEMQTEQRPWLAFEIFDIADVPEYGGAVSIGDDGRVVIGISQSLFNSGHYPGTTVNVHYSAKPIALEMLRNGAKLGQMVRENQTDACKQSESPNGDIAFPSRRTTTALKAQFFELSALTIPGKDIGAILVTGCIGYRTGANGIFGHT